MQFESAFLPLLIFAKAPEPGQVKTRLIPALGASGACDLYVRLLKRTLTQTFDWPGPRFLYASDPTHPLLRALATEHGLKLRQQLGEDLGERMANAIAEHPDGALLIGSDCPDMDSAHVLAACRALNRHDTAIIPSEDGGYVLIGQREANPAPFESMDWSHEQVLEDTRQRLQAAGLTLWEGPALWDLDTPGDLARLPSELRDITLQNAV